MIMLKSTGQDAVYAGKTNDYGWPFPGGILFAIIWTLMGY